MQSFLPLQSALKPLRFDPALDFKPEGFEEYRRFYQLDALRGPLRERMQRSVSQILTEPGESHP